jgi:cell wall assembly regulator SMI1
MVVCSVPKKRPMHVEDFSRRFQKVAEQRGLNYFLSAPASDEEMKRAERKLSVSFPEQVSRFYRSVNGLRVEDPRIEVLPVERLNFTSSNRLHFATLDASHSLYFDVSHLNDADQWDILAEDDYRVTFTMASFWSNKIWHWVEERRRIWREWSEWEP